MQGEHVAVWWSSLLDLIYPRTCEGCRRPLLEGDGRFLCWDCRSQALFIRPPFCRKCGEPVSGAIDHAYTCHHCMDTAPHYDMARSCVMYDGVMRDMLIKFKYHAALWVAHDLVDLLAACLDAHFDVAAADGFIYVPLYHRKLRERGFNQSQILAAALAKRYHKPLFNRFLKRTRMTESQTKLTAWKRKTNVRGVFEARWARWLEGKKLILLDDVMTTGATVNECARVLKNAGTAVVDVLTVARGII